MRKIDRNTGPIIKDGRGIPIKRSGPALLAEQRRGPPRKKAKRQQPERNQQFDAAALEAQRLAQARGKLEEAASLVSLTRPGKAKAIRGLLEEL